MGDGVLVYFGYPEAHEDDAERAVRAGLALVEAVGGLPVQEPLQVRIGVATGLVVVGDLIGSGEAQERGVVGETPNLAARLQGIAAPNTVVIAARSTPPSRRISKVKREPLWDRRLRARPQTRDLASPRIPGARIHDGRGRGGHSFGRHLRVFRVPPLRSRHGNRRLAAAPWAQAVRNDIRENQTDEGDDVAQELTGVSPVARMP
jgi:hypothetical protein